MRTTVWGNGKISSLAIPQPSTARPIRKWAEYMAHDPSYPVDVQAAAQAWLAKH
jgi:hypothetical protein